MRFSARSLGLLLAATVVLTAFPAFAAIPAGGEGGKTVPINPAGPGTDVPQTPAEPTPVDPDRVHPAPQPGGGGPAHLESTGGQTQTGGLNTPPAVSGYNLQPIAPGATLGTQPGLTPDMSPKVAPTPVHITAKGKHIPEGIIVVRRSDKASSAMPTVNTNLPPDAHLTPGAMMSGPTLGTINSETKPTPPPPPPMHGSIQEKYNNTAKNIIQSMGR